MTTELTILLPDFKTAFVAPAPRLLSSVWLIYIQIDLEVNQMSLFSGSRGTRWDNEIRVRWVLHLHWKTRWVSRLMQRPSLWAYVCVCVCGNDLTSSIYLANIKVNVFAHVWSFIWQLCIENMFPLRLWELLWFGRWIHFYAFYLLQNKIFLCVCLGFLLYMYSVLQLNIVTGTICCESIALKQDLQ